MIRTQIQDPKDRNKTASVDDQGGLIVSVASCPPRIKQKNKIFRQYFTNGGGTSDSNDMLVDGSSTSVEFWIPAQQKNDLYITMVSFIIADAGAELNEFGGVSALTNGCDFEYTNNEGETITIGTALKTNWDFVRMCCGLPAFGDGATVFRANNVSGASEGYIPFFNFLQLLPPYGLKLDAGTSEKLIIRINDDCSDPDEFNAIAYGFERFE